MAKKPKKSEVIISINPMQDDLEKIGVGAAGLDKSLPVKAVKAVKEGIKKGVEAVKKTKEKISNKISEKVGEGSKVHKAVGEGSKFNEALMNKPKRTTAGMGVAVGARTKNKWDEGGYDRDLSDREGSFKKGGLVRSGKPKLAKKGWR